ncbi:MAG: hypothetical protein ACYSR9_10365 [Planctomycetota bacterium]
MRSKFFTLIVLTAITISFMFGGCGGGGGGDGGDGDGDGGTYNGVTSQADIDENNAQVMIAGAFEAANSGMAATQLPASIQQHPSDYETVHGFQALKLPIALKNAVVSTDVTNLSGRFLTSAVGTESGTLYGDCGGQASYIFEANDVAGTFNGSMTFLSYCHDGVTISGQTNIQGTFDTATDEPLKITITFDNLESDYITLDGEISMDLTAIPYVVEMNFYGTDEASDKVYWIRDYKLKITEVNGDTEVELTGKFYHPGYGYVVLTTPVLFVIYEGDDFPYSGSLVLTGANGTKAELNAIDYLYCECKSDSDGDGAYEWESGAMLWSDLYETEDPVPSPPTSGEWSGTAGFGEIDFVVNAEGNGIEEVTITFKDYKCGIVTSNGILNVSFNPPSSIDEGHVAFDFDLDPPPVDETLTMEGTFNAIGTSISGTYEADFYGTMCTGTWSASPGSASTPVKIEWDDSTPQKLISREYSGGLLSAMKFFRRFTVTSASGDLQIKATLKDVDDSVFDEMVKTFYVEEDKTYQIEAYVAVGGHGICGQYMDIMEFSSPSVSSVRETLIDDCVSIFNIKRITLTLY